MPSPLLHLPGLLQSLAFALFSGPAIPITVLVGGTLVAIAGIWFHDRERARWHATARLAMEKGQPLPAHPDEEKPLPPTERRHRQRMGLIIAGLVNLGVGVALFLGISAIPDAHVARFFVAIPAFIGLALLVSGLFDALLRPRSAEAARAESES